MAHDTVRLILVQFKVNPFKASDLSELLSDHGELKSRERSPASEGKQVIQQERCDVRSLLELNTHYRLTNGYRAHRTIPVANTVRGGSFEKAKDLVRFFFEPCSDGRNPLAGEEPEKRQKALKALELLSTTALWTAMVYHNPFTGQDAKPGDLLVSATLSECRPFLGGDGKPITERPKDEQGNVIRGSKAVPITGKARLCVSEEGFSLKEVQDERAA